MRRAFRLWLSAVLAIILPLLILVPAQFPVQAQGDDGDDEEITDAYERYREDGASVTGGEAEWVIEDSTFTSNYPEGFTFTATADSSAGELVSVSVFYSFNPRFEDDTRQRGTVDPETGEVEVVVAGPEAEGIPPWVEVNYRWRLLDDAGTVYLSEWYIGDEYEDNTRQWTRVETDDAIIFLQDGIDDSLVDMMTDALAQRSDLYISFFGRHISFRPRAIFFRDLTSFDEWRGLDVNQGGAITVGLSSGRWGGTVQVVFAGDLNELAYGTLVHEILHQYQFDLYESNSPGWFTEGVASYFEISKSYDYEERVRRLAVNGNLPQLFTEFGGPQVDGVGADNRPRLGYDVGYTFILWMIETYGIEYHRQIIEELAEREVRSFEFIEIFEEIMEDVFSRSVIEIENEWRAWLGAEPVVEEAAPEVVEDPLFPEGTAITIEGFRPLITAGGPGEPTSGAVCTAGTDMIVLQTVETDLGRFVEVECDGGTGWLPEEDLEG